jgi:hypothetical protein
MPHGAGVKQANRLPGDIENFVIELFSLWDQEQTGLIPLDDLVNDLLAMGLAPNAKFAEFVVY